MKIAVDAFGGDNAPDAVILGAALAVGEYGVNIILTGDERVITSRIQELGISDNNIEIAHTDSTIKVCDNPLDIRKAKRNSSMGLAFTLVCDGTADAFVSAGSTAALVIGGATLTGRLKGVKRVALAPIMPGSEGFYLFMDGGANLECRADMLLQFGVMGSIFAERIMGIVSPRVGLLNVGTEDEKGRELEREALTLLRSAPINFIGNVEGRDPILGACDVVITDGFTGNVYLKAVEGMGSLMKMSLNRIFRHSPLSMAGYLLTKKGVKQLSKRMDYKETGGSPLLGSAKPVIKAHGSSDARAIKNAIKQAIGFVEKNVNAEIENKLLEFK